MSKTKSSGRAKEKSPRPGKRLGVKVSGGQNIKTGQIIVRQRGTGFHPGDGVGLGRDFTIFAMKEGKVTFKKRKGRDEISVI